MDKSPTNKRARYIRSDANQNQRTVLALQASGLSQRAIARKTGLDVKTVNRHAKAIRQELNAARNIVDDVSDELAKLQTPADIAKNIVKLSTKAKNEAVRDSMTKYSVEIRGGITDKERQRNHQSGSSEPQPMFVLPPGCNLALTINQQNNTISQHDTPTCSELQSLHNTPNVTRDNSTTIGRASQSAHDIDQSGDDIVHE